MADNTKIDGRVDVYNDNSIEEDDGGLSKDIIKDDLSSAAIQRKHAAMIQRLSNLHQSRLASCKPNSDPNSSPDSTQSFLSHFSGSKKSIESELSRVCKIQDPTDLRSELEKVSTSIANLEKQVAESSYFLPSYEVRSCLKTVSDLKQALEQANSTVIPKKKFSFLKTIFLAVMMTFTLLIGCLRYGGGSGNIVAVEDWVERPHTIEEVKAMLYGRKELEAAATLRRPRRDLFRAFSEQMWRGGNNNPSSIDTEDESRERQQWQSSHHYRSPPTKLVVSSSPQSSREDRKTNCPDVRGSATMPSYMAATESAKARIRSQSAPRHRASSKKPENPAKKRLSYPVPDPCVGTGYCLRSPSFKSVASGVYGYENHSNYSSPLYTESVGGEVSSRDLRRWLR